MSAGDNVLRIHLLILCWVSVAFAPVLAQSTTSTRPIEGLRENLSSQTALVGAHVIVQPGQALHSATVLLEGNVITAMGADLEVPPGFKRVDCRGLRVYAGFIDAYSEIDVPVNESDVGHWNPNVTPQRRARSVATTAKLDREELRSQGFAAQLVAPRGRILKGYSCLTLLSDGDQSERLLKDDVWQHIQLTVPRGSSRSSYPNSPMGAVALIRQTFLDSEWYQQAWHAYQANSQLTRPDRDVPLSVLASARRDTSFVFDTQNERMAIRAINIAGEFSLKPILRGSGREYQVLEQITAANVPFLLPVNFPEAPDVTSVESESSVTLGELMHWDLAPENPGRLSANGVSICLTTDGLSDTKDFLTQVRRAVQRGLDPDAALAAMTTTPARLLGMTDHLGQVRPGMMANLFVADGDIFDDETKVIDCWVAGVHYSVESTEEPHPLVGKWQLLIPGDETAKRESIEIDFEFSQEGDSVKGVARSSEEVKLTLQSERDRIETMLDLSEVQSDLPEGTARISWLAFPDRKSEAPRALARVTLSDGSVVDARMRLLDEGESKADSGEADRDQPQQEDDAGEPDSKVSEESVAILSPVLYPFGAFGKLQRDQDPHDVLLKGATLWTCGSQGVMVGDILLREQKIVEIAKRIEPTDGCDVINVRGKHITPGLIDCHSHMATDGGVNESAQAVTAEVRVGDFIDNSDINIYRQIAGGVTTSNILHGSACTIGGQNQVIKLRWGQTMDGMKLKRAPPGIKFALGENVKRNQSRYPNTRMGVQQLMRDQLLAAREYDARWRRWRSGERSELPPRRDLQLEALAEVQRGERWVHCHSYRQDEIVATLDVLEEFGIRIGTLQHILEGYKVADRMARHGAMASAFSDWWAYKFEVFDAIPYNGALMHQQGLVVSFNSDDRELARHLNHEAAKAIKYGGVSEEDALKFVTLNPAKQLRIDEFVGSLTPGKDADLVVWSGHPLSTLSRCEQTWIDGSLYFDTQVDLELRDRDRELKAKLVQKAIQSDSKLGETEEKVAEEERWVRDDVFCATYGGAIHDQEGGIRE